jgi:polysaccharide biosynthesis/export protein
MWLERGGLALIAVFLAVVSTACKSDSSCLGTLFGCPPDGSFNADSKAPPSFNSAAPKANNGPRQETQPVGNASVGRPADSRASVSTSRNAVSDPSAARAAEAIASLATPGSKAYRIGPQDVLDISVFQAPELTKTVEVADNGNIELPLVGDMPAAGKTAQELQRDLNSRLGAKYLQNPQSTVTVKEFNHNRVTVSGAVKGPGVFPYKGQSLFEFVTMAGGLAWEATSTVIVLRVIDGKRSAAKFNIADIQAGRAPDPPVEAGDLIVAESSKMKEGYNALFKILPLAGFAALATL